jgi:hypothetical protein
MKGIDKMSVNSLMSKSEIEKVIDDKMNSIKAQVNLTDWGDLSFRIPLAKLIEAFEKENPSQDVYQGFMDEISRLLTNRLLVQNEINLHPEILRTPVERPLFIIGLGRTGSTLLHNLLAQDPQARTPLIWEMLWPLPYKHLNDFKDNNDQRLKWAEELVATTPPQLKIMHEIKVNGPDECSHLMKHTFMTLSFCYFFNVPSYFIWLFKQDQTEAYRYYKKLLQLLLWQKPANHLVLKDPLHLCNLTTLAKVFPGANFIWLHRDPAKVVSSLYSMNQILSNGMELDPSQAPSISNLMSDLQRLLKGGMKMRNRLKANQFLDVYYHELVQNPFEVIRKIYQNFNYPWSPGFQENMEKWMAENPKNKHGVHRHDLEMFGVEPARVQNAFKFYYRHFGVPVE